MDIKKQQDRASNVWDEVYKVYEEDKPVGIKYPTEALVVFIATQRKSKNIGDYHSDVGKEHSMRTGFTGNALEIGFGSIANLKMTAEFGYDCYGLKVSNEAVVRGNKFIKDNNINNIKLSHWQPYQIPFADNNFALIYGLQCIYYNLEMDKVINEIYRSLEPGGKFLFSFFSKNHSYMNWIEQDSGVIYRWTDEHPNKRLRGCSLYQPQSENELIKLFGKFENVRVFLTESNQTPLMQSWWYVTGTKG